MEIQKKHYHELDIYKGLGIILVVLGHALKQTSETNMIFDILLSFIYSFHMPLFFVASGFIAIKILDFSALNIKINFIKNRALRLLVPYFTVGLFYMPIKFVLSKYAVKPYDFSNAWKLLIGENPNTVLWFLYTLFIVSVLCVLMLNRKNITIFLVVSAALSIFAWMFDSDFNTLKYLFFFIFGLYLRINYEKFLEFLKGIRLVVLWFVFIIANYFLYVTGLTGLTFITAISGCLCILALSLTISHSTSFISRVSTLCGKYSMDIYILSDLFATAVRIALIGLLNIHYIPCTVLCFIFSMFLPIPISKYFIRKVQVLKLLILGERS